MRLRHTVRDQIRDVHSRGGEVESEGLKRRKNVEK